VWGEEEKLRKKEMQSFGSPDKLHFYNVMEIQTTQRHKASPLVFNNESI